MASATTAVALGDQRVGQARTLHGNRGELGITGCVRREIFDPPDASERENVRQIRRVNIFAPQKNLPSVGNIVCQRTVFLSQRVVPASDFRQNGETEAG